jgi:hypothetical protein
MMANEPLAPYDQNKQAHPYGRASSAIEQGPQFWGASDSQRTAACIACPGELPNTFVPLCFVSSLSASRRPSLDKDPRTPANCSCRVWKAGCLSEASSHLPLLQFFEPCMKAWTTGCRGTTVDGLIHGVADKQDSFILLTNSTKYSYFIWTSELLACCLYLHL